MYKDFNILSREEEKKLDKASLLSYYRDLRDYYGSLYSIFEKENVKQEKVHNFFRKIAPIMRKYEIIIDGENNLHLDSSVIFCCNHSNTHDYYTIQEVFSNMVNVLVASDSLNGFTRNLFRMSGSVLIDRDSKVSSFNGLNSLTMRLVLGNNAFIFPEGTWNILPSELMLPFKIGVITTAVKANKPIVPVIFEYVEVNDLCTKENELYDKLVIKVGEPMYVDYTKDYYFELDRLRNIMIDMRKSIREEFYPKDSFSYEIYRNHTDLKCRSLLFNYDNLKESSYICDKEISSLYKNYPIKYEDYKRILKI